MIYMSKTPHAGCGKFAMRGLSQSLAKEFHPAGVHIAHVIIDGVIGDRRLVVSATPFLLHSIPSVCLLQHPTIIDCSSIETATQISSCRNLRGRCQVGRRGRRAGNIDLLAELLEEERRESGRRCLNSLVVACSQSDTEWSSGIPTCRSHPLEGCFQDRKDNKKATNMQESIRATTD